MNTGCGSMKFKNLMLVMLKNLLVGASCARDPWQLPKYLVNLHQTAPANAKLKCLPYQHKVKDIDDFVSIDIGDNSRALIAQEPSRDDQIRDIDYPIVV